MRIAKEVKVYTTPDELREWADKMEEVWDAALIGQSLSLRIFTDDELSLSLCIDQDRMREAGK